MATDETYEKEGYSKIDDEDIESNIHDYEDKEEYKIKLKERWILKENSLVL